MKTFNYLKAITFLFLVSLGTQSCSPDSEISLQGRMIDEASGLAIENAVFTLYDYSTGPNISNIFGFIGEEQVLTDKDGVFELKFDIRESADDLHYEYGSKMITSDVLPLSINVGETLDMGDLFIPETIEVIFDVTSLDLNNQKAIEISTRNEDKFAVRNINEIGTVNTLKGYVYPNQFNKVSIFQAAITGGASPKIFEFTVGEITKGDVIVLEK